MKTIYKLVLKSYLGPMVLTFFIIMFVLMMNVLWRYIDELVGKGLDPGTIIELLCYATINMIPMALPLATLLAAIMTMGNLGENYELLAMKSAGMSLPKIMRPLLVVVSILAVGSFFIANNLVPYANKKFFRTIYDIRQMNQTLDFQDGLFFNGIDGMSIRVGHQNQETGLLTDVLIYDNRNASGNMTTTVADSGYIRLSDDKRFLEITLFNGERYEQTRNSSQWYNKSSLQRNKFELQKANISISGFEMQRTDADLFNNAQTKNISELQYEIDTLTQQVNSATTRSYDPLLKERIFVRDTTVITDRNDSVVVEKRDFRPIDALDSLPALQGPNLEPGRFGRTQLPVYVLVRRIAGQKCAQPTLPQQGRMAQEIGASGDDHHLLPDRSTAGRYRPQRRSGYADRNLGHLLRHLLHYQQFGRKDGQRGYMGGILRHVALGLRTGARRHLPHIQGHERLGAARRGLVRRKIQENQGEDLRDIRTFRT